MDYKEGDEGWFLESIRTDGVVLELILKEFGTQKATKADINADLANQAQGKKRRFVTQQQRKQSNIQEKPERGEISLEAARNLDLKDYSVFGVDPGVNVIAAAAKNANERVSLISKEEYHHLALKGWSEKVRSNCILVDLVVFFFTFIFFFF